MSIPAGKTAIPPVLMYHSVTNDRRDRSPWTVDLRRFEQQMRWLSRRGLQGVSMQEALRGRPGSSGKRLIGLTFDDGYRDFLECALPVLERYDFTATAFVVAGCLGGKSEWSDRDPWKALLTAEEVRSVAVAGVEIGSHGLRHVSLPSVADGDLASEVSESRRILQVVSGQEVRGFCYPFGEHDARVLDRTQATGYDYACATGYPLFTGHFALPRIYVGNSDSPARLWAKATRHWLRWQYSGPGSRAIADASAVKRRAKAIGTKAKSVLRATLP
jgi:peptidoglycan/xylan/chitin deacetylase (PgdA/CDA1 family)